MTYLEVAASLFSYFCICMSVAGTYSHALGEALNTFVPRLTSGFVLLAGLEKKSYGVPGIKPWSPICKASTLSIVLLITLLF